jgi:hypothetical protein
MNRDERGDWIATQSCQSQGPPEFRIEAPATFRSSNVLTIFSNFYRLLNFTVFLFWNLILENRRWGIDWLLNAIREANGINWDSYVIFKPRCRVVDVNDVNRFMSQAFWLRYLRERCLHTQTQYLRILSEFFGRAWMWPIHNSVSIEKTQKRARYTPILNDRPKNFLRNFMRYRLECSIFCSLHFRTKFQRT